MREQHKDRMLQQENMKKEVLNLPNCLRLYRKWLKSLPGCIRMSFTGSGKEDSFFPILAGRQMK